MDLTEINEDIKFWTKALQAYQNAGFYNTVNSVAEIRMNLIKERNKILKAEQHDL